MKPSVWSHAIGRFHGSGTGRTVGGGGKWEAEAETAIEAYRQGGRDSDGGQCWTSKCGTNTMTAGLEKTLQGSRATLLCTGNPPPPFSYLQFISCGMSKFLWTAMVPSLFWILFQPPLSCPFLFSHLPLCSVVVLLFLPLLSIFPSVSHILPHSLLNIVPSPPSPLQPPQDFMILFNDRWAALDSIFSTARNLILLWILESDVILLGVYALYSVFVVWWLNVHIGSGSRFCSLLNNSALSWAHEMWHDK